LKRTALVTIAIVFSFLVLGIAFGEDTGKSYYILGPSDVIEISVWNHPELTKTMRIRPDGWVSFPLVGELQAAGQGPADLANQIHQKLLSYFKDPQVSVIVNEYKSKSILVLGQVKKPGLYQYEGGMTAFEAIGVAEGYNKHAQLKSIVVIRNGYTAVPEFYLVNLYKAIHDGITQEDVFLQPRDIVYVPQNFFGNVADFTDYWMQRIKPAADTYFMSAIAGNQ